MKISEEILDNISSLSKITFWVDSGLNFIKLNKKYQNYQSVFCSEKSQGYEMISNKFNKCVCSLDFMHKYLGKKFIYRHERANHSKVILMDMMQVGSNKKINYKKFLNEYEKYKNLYNIRNHQNITEIRDVISKYGENAKIYLGGIPMIADDMMSYIKNDIAVFGIGVFIFIIFL